MNAAREHVFVWYRVREGDRARARDWVVSMQRIFGERGPRWYCRSQDDIETWMEVYAPEHAASLDAIERAATADGVHRWIDGGRHVERFVEFEGAPCA